MSVVSLFFFFFLTPLLTRNEIKDILSKTDDYPETLTKTINSIQASLPEFKPDEPGILQQVQEIISAQERPARSMAAALMSLASHYDNMATALKESENGEAFTDKELQGNSMLLLICLSTVLRKF